MKAHDETKLLVLRGLKSAIKNSEIQKQQELTDSDCLGVIQSQIKTRNDSITMYNQGNRPELAAKEQAEIDILKTYLPEQMSEEEVKSLVLEAIKTSSATSMQDMGKVMGILMPQVKGKADPSLISAIVKTELSK